MPDEDQEGSAVTNPEDTRTKIKRAVAEMVAGSALHVEERPNELVITNPATRRGARSTSTSPTASCPGSA